MRINWDATGERRYEVGVDRGVLYQDVGGAFESGVPWNGLTNVDADDNGHENTPLYTGDVKRGNLSTYSEFGGTITAYTYPDEFEPCIGSVEAVPGIFTQQQKRAHFGLCYRSLIGNDVDGQEHGYKLHLIYDAEVTSCSVSRPTINDSAEAVEFEWEFEAMPQLSDDFDPYSEIIIDSTRFSSEFMEQLEDILYGTEEEAPRLPTLEELLELFYVEEPVPASWEGYPHMRVYPATDLYPCDLSLHCDVTLTVPAQTLDIISVGRSGHDWTEPFIPVNATILSQRVINIPVEYEDKIGFEVSISDDREEIILEYRNISGEVVTISEDFDVTAKISYIVEEEENA